LRARNIWDGEFLREGRRYAVVVLEYGCSRDNPLYEKLKAGF
jgi:hypothetical protein